MASKLKRTIYTHSGVRIEPHDVGAWWGDADNFWGNQLYDWDTAGFGLLGRAAGNQWVQPKTVQNATMTLNIPRADVNVFGVLGVVDRPQLEAETATIEFSFIPEKRNSHQLTLANSSIYPTDIQGLIHDALEQEPRYVWVWADGVGYIENALMNSMSGEATIGALPTFTMGFTGRTGTYDNLDGSSTPNFNVNPTDAGCFNAVNLGGDCPVPAKSFDVSLVEPGDIDLHQIGDHTQPLDEAQSGVMGDVNPNLINEHPETADPDGAGPLAAYTDNESVVNPDTDLHVQTGCAQSASFAWDLPVETLLCLGGNPKLDGHTLGNPPGTASMTVEALSLQLEKNTNAQNYNLRIGIYNFQLGKGAIDSRTHNLAVGDLFGSYNYVIGGTADGFYPVNINGSLHVIGGPPTNGIGKSLDGTV
jgi:hypothetical protein